MTLVGWAQYSKRKLPHHGPQRRLVLEQAEKEAARLVLDSDSPDTLVKVGM